MKEQKEATKAAIENLLGRQNELNNREFFKYIQGALHISYKLGLITLTERLDYDKRAEEKMRQGG